MNTEKSAIEKMVGAIEAHKNRMPIDTYNKLKAIIGRLAAEEKSKPAPVEAKATAEGSSVPCQVNDFDNDGPCPHMNKDGTIPCAYIKKDCPSYRPASPAVEELVRELREWSIGCHTQDDDGRAERCPGLSKFDQILAKYDNAKGGK